MAWEVRGHPALGPWPSQLLCVAAARSSARPRPPTRAPGKQPLRKSLHRASRAGVPVKALDGQGRRLGWADDGQEDAQADVGAPSSWGSRPPPALTWPLGMLAGPAPSQPLRRSLAVGERLVLRAEQRLGLLVPGVMGAGQGPARGEAGRGWGGHDTRLQPHDQRVVGERSGTCR